jgi:hypothetical protein
LFLLAGKIDWQKNPLADIILAAGASVHLICLHFPYDKHYPGLLSANSLFSKVILSRYRYLTPL